VGQIVHFFKGPTMESVVSPQGDEPSRALVYVQGYVVGESRPRMWELELQKVSQQGNLVFILGMCWLVDRDERRLTEQPVQYTGHMIWVNNLAQGVLLTD